VSTSTANVSPRRRPFRSSVAGTSGRHRRHRPDQAESESADVVRADVEDRAGPVRTGAGLGWCHSCPGLTKNALAPTIAEPAVVDEAAARLQPPAHERVGRAAHPQARGVGDGQRLAALRERRGEGFSK
jgi:hypothetical protein